MPEDADPCEIGGLKSRVESPVFLACFERLQLVLVESWRSKGTANKGEISLCDWIYLQSAFIEAASVRSGDDESIRCYCRHERDVRHVREGEPMNVA